MLTANPVAAIEQLNRILSGSRAAQRAYAEALARAEKGRVREVSLVRKMLRDHTSNAVRVESEIVRLGGQPRASAEAFQVWSRMVKGVKSLFVSPDPLRALKSGELQELRTVRVAEAVLDPYSGRLLRDILVPSYLSHILTLDGLIGRATPMWMNRPIFGME